MHEELFALFPHMLKRHVPHLVIHGDRARGCCPFHVGNNPQAFTADLKKGAWQCWNCHAHGGIVAFAKLTGERLPGKDYRPPPALHVVRLSLAQQVESEYRAWKDDKYGDIVQRIGEAQSVVASLLACQRFALSDAESLTLGRVLSEWYSDLDQLTEEMDTYSPNPCVDDTEARREWLESQDR